ncbi:MAG: hypothetical protein ACJAS6_000936 [Rickettsiales bacterium]
MFKGVNEAINIANEIFLVFGEKSTGSKQLTLFTANSIAIAEAKNFAIQQTHESFNEQGLGRFDLLTGFGGRG